jgi:hypothetical protein
LKDADRAVVVESVLKNRFGQRRKMLKAENVARTPDFLGAPGGMTVEILSA